MRAHSTYVRTSDLRCTPGRPAGHLSLFGGTSEIHPQGMAKVKYSIPIFNAKTKTAQGIIVLITGCSSGFV